MLLNLSSTPLWLHGLAALLVIESIASRLIINSNAVNYGDRTPPPQHIQRKIERFVWGLTVAYIGVIAFFWLGHNWARLFVLCGSLISLFNGVSSFKMANQLAKVYCVFDTVFSACVIFVLLQPSVVAYFHMPR